MENINPPSQSSIRKIATTAMSGFSTIPFIGGVLTDVGKHLLQRSYDIQLDEWRHCVASALETLHSKQVDLEKLSDDRRFTRIFVHASSMASKLAPKEKLDYLKHGLVYTGLAPKDENTEETINIFMRFIDEFTVGHIKTLVTLKNLNEPIYEGDNISDYAKKQTGLSQTAFYVRDFSKYGLIIDVQFDGLMNTNINDIWNNLNEDQKVKTKKLRTTPIVTGFGTSFLYFIGELSDEMDI